MGPVYKYRVGEFVNLPVTKTDRQTTEGLGENRTRGRPFTRSETRNSQTNKRRNKILHRRILDEEKIKRLQGEGSPPPPPPVLSYALEVNPIFQIIFRIPPPKTLI